MNIFEQLDSLLKSARKINESSDETEYSELEIEPTMSTAEQAKQYIRDYFEKLLDDDEKAGMPGGGLSRLLPVEPPPPPFTKEGKGDSSVSKDWCDKDLEWDADDYKSGKIEGDEFDDWGDFTLDDDDFDDFTDKPKKGSSGGSGSGSTDDTDPDSSEEKEKDEYAKSGKSSGRSDSSSYDDMDDVSGSSSSSSSSSESGDRTKGDGDSSGAGRDDSSKRDDETKGGDSSDAHKGDEDGSSSSGDDDGDDEGHGTGSWADEPDDDEEEPKSGGGVDGEHEDDDETRDGETGIDTGETEAGEGGGKGEGEGDEESGGEGDDDGGDDDGGGSSMTISGLDEKGLSDEELEETIKDAIDRLSEKHESESEELGELKDMLDDPKMTDGEIEERSKMFDEMRDEGKEKEDKLKSLVGKVEDTPSKEDIEKEIEASKLSEDEIKKLKKATLDSASSAKSPTDEELDDLKKSAMSELEKKCKGHSKLSSSILYHSLSTPKIDKDDWDRIIEKILKKRAKYSVENKKKEKRVILGDKNHMWRDVRYGYKKVKTTVEKQSIYCFIDYSGSVSCQPGLIVSFLGKILELLEKLNYTDMQLYTFADKLSVPRVINQSMVNKEGYEKVLADTIAYFDLPENYVGGSIENFSLVGYEVNKIKKNDKDAVIFIFGDGVWTFYGNSDPPTKLKETCPRWIKDIIAFVFYVYDGSLKYLSKEISLLKDVVGIEDVIVTKASEMEE